MTEISSHTAPTSRDAQRFRERFIELSIAALLLVVVAGLWLVFFSFFPLELVPPRIR